MNRGFASIRTNGWGIAEAILAGLALLPMLLVVEAIGWLVKRLRRRAIPPEFGEPGLGCPADLVPRTPVLAGRHAQAWPED